MATLQEISAQLDRACELVGQARHAAGLAAEHLGDAVSVFVAAMDGSVDPQVETVHALWDHAWKGMGELQVDLNSVIEAVRAYRASLVRASASSENSLVAGSDVGRPRATPPFAVRP